MSDLNLAHELYAMAQGPQPIEDAVRAIADRLATHAGAAAAEPVAGHVLVPRHFLSDVHTAAGLVMYGKQCKALAKRLSEGVMAGYAAPLADLTSAPAVPEATVLKGVDELVHEAYAHWDADREFKVGKILLALIGHNKGYDKRADAWRAAIGGA